MNLLLTHMFAASDEIGEEETRLFVFHHCQHAAQLLAFVFCVCPRLVVFREDKAIRTIFPATSCATKVCAYQISLNRAPVNLVQLLTTQTLVSKLGDVACFFQRCVVPLDSRFKGGDFLCGRICHFH